MPIDDTYSRFLSSKHVRVQATGFDVPEERLCQSAFDWQRLSVRWWLRQGRASGFFDCGLGKTLMQLAWGEAICLSGHGKRVLILTPPAVAQQTKSEGEKFGIRVAVKVVRNQSQVESGISVTNYERLHLFDPSQFDAVALDEASILKSFMGKTKQQLLSLFKETKYRLTATATPAPNDYLELGNQADFLGVMRANEMLMRWFINDSMHAGNYRLKGHAEADYWRWVSSWAVAASKPSDLGDYSDAGYILPPLNLEEHVIGGGSILSAGDKQLSATQVHKAKRARASAWAMQIASLVAEKRCLPWVIWCDTNYEADWLKRAMPDAVEVRGSHSLDKKEELLAAFTHGEIKHLITKPEIAGFGLNWQHCCNTTFPASYSFERLYQAICRLRRFGQVNTVNCHIVLVPEELGILATVREKAAAHDLMKCKMVEAMKDFQNENLHGNRQLKAAEEPMRFWRWNVPGVSQESPLRASDEWSLWHGDCVAVARDLADDSIDFTIHSPPFSNLYIYSDSSADMGNARDHAEFFAHYEFLIEQLYRATTPGRLCAVHCKDLPLYKGRDGAAGLYPFPCDITAAFLKHGWIYHSHVTIWKDPVTEMQRTKNHGLLHRQLCKDSSASRQGMADYLLVFRKWNEAGEFLKPVTRGNPFARFNHYVGESGPAVDSHPFVDISGAPLVKADDYSIQVWQRYASPVWFDIKQMRVLNYRLGRDDKDEKHICPLQLDVIERSIELWTNPGDLVFDPFNGIGSSGYVALKTGRQYVGSELKDSYVRESLRNFEAALSKREAEAKNVQPALPLAFDDIVPASEVLAV